MEIKRIVLFALVFLAATSAICESSPRKRLGDCEEKKSDALAAFKTELTQLLAGIKQQNSDQGSALVTKLTDQVIELYNLLGDMHRKRGSERAIKESVKRLLATVEDIKTYLETDTNVVKGDHNKVAGNCNFINGNLNVVQGVGDSIEGDKNKAVGDDLALISTNSKVRGTDSFLVGKNTVVCGNKNVVFANNKVVKGSNKLCIDNYTVDLNSLDNEKRCVEIESDKRDSDRH